ncbi:DUF5941 domain-containing protein [Streptomyces sp. NBRC 109706]|uniref:DUF5941 domain-containing protein n=1 Tax=Streptomyces sp. NBRC 109706 TaxID=1550035 RepID=UPI0007845CB2|nr:DUF5941 domain-containing protein [Streptomyces sp. NBRC 109706]
MSSAILTGPPVAGSPLEEDLRALGFSVTVAERPAELARALAEAPAGERVAVVDPRFVGHRHSLRLGLTDPRFPTSAIPGAVTATGPARPALAAAVAALGDSAAQAGGPLAAPPEAGRLAALLAAEGAEPHRPELGTLVAEVPTGERARAEAAERVASVDEEAVRLRGAVKSRDGFVTTHLVSPYSRYLARWCARRGLTPNQVTTASLVTALIAAGCAATGDRLGFVAAGLLLLASFVLDCADGQLARYALRYSTLGAWLDATFDRAKEYAFYAGLALGAARSGDDVWALALGAMVLMTCRHIVDFAYNEAHPPSPSGGGASAISGRLDRIGWTVWARRMIVLPIGERWLLIAVLIACTNPRTTFTVLLVASAFAACYTTAGRLLRSLRARGGTASSAPAALAGLADNGPLAGALGRPLPALARALPAPVWALLGLVLLGVTLPPLVGEGSWLAVLGAVGYALCAGRAAARPLRGALDWLLPPLFRAGEYLTVLLLAAHSEVNGALPAAFCLVAASAYHHYDTVYRLRGGAGAPPRWLVMATGGHEGRVLVVTVACALWAGGQGFTIALAALAGVVALLVLGESIRFWISSQAPAVHDETGEPA